MFKKQSKYKFYMNYTKFLGFISIKIGIYSNLNNQKFSNIINLWLNDLFIKLINVQIFSITILIICIKTLTNLNFYYNHVCLRRLIKIIFNNV